MSTLRNVAFLAASAAVWFAGCGSNETESGDAPRPGQQLGEDAAITPGSRITPDGYPVDASATDAPATMPPDATVTPCVPSCASKGCGASDGCGGSCTTCTAGPGCEVATGKCLPCTKACGANGTCVHGWTGQSCQCAAGYYETLNGCAPAAGTVCDGVSCGAGGTCFSGPPLNSAQCHCSGNTIVYGKKCAPIDKIRCIDRDGKLADKGTIRCSDDDSAYEVCRDGNGDGKVEWVASGTPSCDAGTTCSACRGKKCNSGDGTGGEPCPTGTVCMAKVHEWDVYTCMPGCDCSNCGTCNPDQFTGWQRSCGSSTDDFDSATIACSSPCANASDGCLPYGQFAFCFPNEGCASASP